MVSAILWEIIKFRNASALSGSRAKIYHQHRTYRAVVTGCVVDVIRVTFSIKQGHPERNPRGERRKKKKEEERKKKDSKV